MPLVKAIAAGFYGELHREGDVFEIPQEAIDADPKLLEATWYVFPDVLDPHAPKEPKRADDRKKPTKAEIDKGNEERRKEIEDTMKPPKYDPLRGV
jgi:hypothetical protein